MIIMPYGWSWPIAAAHRPSRLLAPHKQAQTAGRRLWTSIGTAQACSRSFSRRARPSAEQAATIGIPHISDVDPPATRITQERRMW